MKLPTKYFNYIDAQNEKLRILDLENDPISDSIKKRSIIGGAVRSVLKPMGRVVQQEVF